MKLPKQRIKLSSGQSESRSSRFTMRSRAPGTRVKPSRGTLFKIGHHREISVRLPDLAVKNGWDSELTEQYENELADIGVGLERGKPRVPLMLAGEHKREEFQAVMERILKTLIG